jgi:hypothetical protein
MYRKSMFFAVVACLGVLMSTLALAAPPKDSLVITGLTDSNGFAPTLNGSPSEFFYATTVPAGTSVADIIPVQFDAYNNPSTPTPETYTVTFNAVGQVASAISFDTSSFPITDTTTGLVHYVYINTSALGVGDYHANVQISATGTGSAKIDLTHSTLHLLIHVVPAEGPIPPNCYITDSSGLLLSDCAGNAANTGGEFLVVSNQKKITATNPGQFYYNFVWTNNTGSPVTFTSLGLTGTNVVPAGTNSVHVLIYDKTGFTYNFDDVNTIGTPCGQVGGTCKSPITVPDQQTLWLTWHVSYQWIGGTLWPDIPPAGLAGCGVGSTHGTITMSALLQNSDQSVSLGCSAGANGQNIK